MNQSPPETTGARQDQIFLQLLHGSTIPYRTPRPEIRLIGLEICRLTNISEYHQLLTLEGRELQTGLLTLEGRELHAASYVPSTLSIFPRGCRNSELVAFKAEIGGEERGQSMHRAAIRPLYNSLRPSTHLVRPCMTHHRIFVNPVSTLYTFD